MPKKVNKNELTEMQIAFVYYFLEDNKKNATEAARKAGYSEKSAKQKANALLKDSRIVACIRTHEQLKGFENKVNPKSDINAQFILQERIEILKNCKKKIPKMIWDYDTHKSVKAGEEMIDPRSAALVLRDIELSLDDDKKNWTKEEINELFTILSKE